MKPIDIMKMLGGAAPSLLDHFYEQQFTNNRLARTMLVPEVNLGTSGGLIWERPLNTNGASHSFIDTVRGRTKYILPESTGAEGTDENYILDIRSGAYDVKENNFVLNALVSSCVFRCDPKFMNIVTWTGTGGARGIIPGITVRPGMIFCKNLTYALPWKVWHKHFRGRTVSYPEMTQVADTTNYVFSSDPIGMESYSFGISEELNAIGNKYVGYIFGDDPSADSRVVCGTYVGSGEANIQTISSLPFAPRFVLSKVTTTTSWWRIATKTSSTYGGSMDFNTTSTQNTDSVLVTTANGFAVKGEMNKSGYTYVYLAIR